MSEIIQQVEFPDVSFWQGVIDWRKMGSAVIIRGGQNLTKLFVVFERHFFKCASSFLNIFEGFVENTQSLYHKSNSVMPVFFNGNISFSQYIGRVCAFSIYGVLRVGYISEFALSVIQSVMMDMITNHVVRCIHKHSVKPDSFSCFPIPLVNIKCFTNVAPHYLPFYVFYFFVIFVINKSILILGKLDLFHFSPNKKAPRFVGQAQNERQLIF